MSRTESVPEGGAVKVYIRHALSEANKNAQEVPPEERRVGGYQPRIELAPKGYDQAREIGTILRPQLQEMIGDFTVVRFSVAPAVRTRETGREVHAAMGLDVPITVRRSAHEMTKGNRWLGGDEKRLRSDVETPAYKAGVRGDWDFRPGRPWANRLGLHALHGAETQRHAAARIVDWYEEMPPMDAVEVSAGHHPVDVLVAHGIAGYLSLGMLLHRDPESPDIISVSPHEAHQRYEMKNAAATVLDIGNGTNPQLLGIIVPELSKS